MATASRMVSRGWAVLVCVSLSACGPSRPPVPLRPQPIAWIDTLPIVEPEVEKEEKFGTLFLASVGDELFRPVRFRYISAKEKEAVNVTAFDDVVPSSWFQHRNARQPMSASEVVRGAPGVPPDVSGEITIIGGKEEGISPGFFVRDASGERYLFKLDPKGYLHLASSADFISTRLFYAAGYNTPADYIAVIDTAQLVIGEGATIGRGAARRPLTREGVQALLERTDPLPDGRYLVLASHFLPGPLKGPFRLEGRWDKDPNDYYFHEYRRELRGLLAVSAWLNHVDMRYANTMDVFIENPGYIRHYLFDMAATLGSGTIRSHTPREGMEYNFDFWPMTARFFTLGFYEVGWEDEEWSVIYPSVGWMPVEGWEPEKWKPNWPNKAFTLATVRDMYWAAKLVGSFTDEQIEVLVDSAHLPAPAADTLAKMIQYRRDVLVRYWYAQTTPIENVTARSGATAVGSSTVGSETGRRNESLVVAFDDLGIGAGAWRAEDVVYEWRFEHPARGIAVRGTTPAVAGAAPQQIAIEKPPGGGSHALSASEAIATLTIRAEDTSRTESYPENQEARVFLTWDEVAHAYAVTGLEH